MKIEAIVLGLLLGCGNEDPYTYTPTPKGYALSWQNVGAVPDWYSLSGIGSLFDGSVEDAVLYLGKYGAAPELVRSVTAQHRNVGFDAARFAIRASGTGWASGAYIAQKRQILLAFWTRVKGDVVPADAPAWTVYSWPTRPSPAYDWGEIPKAFPALGHEIGHALYGPAFEHGWTPPVVAGAALAAFGTTSWEGDCAYIP